MQCFTQWVARGAHCQNLYSYLIAVKLKLAVPHIVRQNCQFVELAEPERLQLTTKRNSDNTRREEVLGVDSRATMAVHSAKIQVSNIAINFDWFAEYIETNIGMIYVCFFAGK